MKRKLCLAFVLLTIVLGGTYLFAKKENTTYTDSDVNSKIATQSSQSNSLSGIAKISNPKLDTTLASKIKPENYGDWAEYKVDLNDNGEYTDDWKIFYNDGTNVYLIAADYLDNSKIPEGAGMTTYGEYNAYWKTDSDFASKQGMQDVTENVANQFMLKKYKTQYPDVTDINSKATAVLLDTNIWEKFALGFEGSFAYGAPTVEMWTASWNQKGYNNLSNPVVNETHTNKFRCLNGRTETFDTNGYGYRVGNTEDDVKEIMNVSDDTAGYGDVLYFPHTSDVESTENYLLASPTYRSYTRTESCPNTEGAECVTGDTEILTSLDGDTKLAKDMQKNDSILFYDEATETTVLGYIQEVYVHENTTNFVKYTFDDGTYLKSTDYHPIYTKDGWKSLTGKYGYPAPQIGDEVKTSKGYKKITDIEEYVGLEDTYDFQVSSSSHSRSNNYYANDTLVEGTNYTMEDAYHDFTDYKMDCLVSCSYKGDVGHTIVDSDKGNAAIRPIVVLPADAPGTATADGLWKLQSQVELTVHHLEEGTNRTLAPDESQILNPGDTYTTNQSSDVPDSYKFTRRTDNWQGTAEESDIEVTYWYEKKDATVKVLHVLKGTDVSDPENVTDVLYPTETKTGKVDDEYSTQNRETEINATSKTKYRVVNDNVANKSGNMTVDTIYVVYEYETIPAKVKVKHLEKGTNTELYPEETKNGNVGEDYTTEDRLDEINEENEGKYELVEELLPEEPNGTFTEEEKTVTYYYEKKDATVKVLHVLKGTNVSDPENVTDVLYPTETKTGKVDDEYSTQNRETEINATSKTKYRVVNDNVANKSGNMTLDTIYVVYEYEAVSARVKVKHLEKGTNTELYPEETKNGNVGEDYTTEDRLDEINEENEGKYELVEELLPKDPNGTFTEEEKTVTYYYQKKETKVIVKYLEEETEKELYEEITIPGRIDDEYVTEDKVEEINEKENSKYILTRTTENTEGTMTKDVIEVIYWYKKVEAKVEVKHLDVDTGEELADREYQGGYIGDEYTTSPKEIEGYEVVEEKMPQNKDGVYTEEDIVVTYYYKKIPEENVAVTDENVDTSDIPLISILCMAVVSISGITYITLRNNKRKEM